MGSWAHSWTVLAHWVWQEAAPGQWDTEACMVLPKGTPGRECHSHLPLCWSSLPGTWTWCPRKPRPPWEWDGGYSAQPGGQWLHETTTDCSSPLGFVQRVITHLKPLLSVVWSHTYHQGELHCFSYEVILLAACQADLRQLLVPVCLVF